MNSLLSLTQQANNMTLYDQLGGATAVDASVTMKAGIIDVVVGYS